MRDDGMDAGEMELVDAQKAPEEPDAQDLDITEEWPQLTALELAVCLAGSDRDTSSARTGPPR